MRPARWHRSIKPSDTLPGERVIREGTKAARAAFFMRANPGAGARRKDRARGGRGRGEGLKRERFAPRQPPGAHYVHKSQKIAIAAAEGIPFNKLVPSPANVRKSAANLRIEALAEDIALRGLIQSLGVRTGPDGAYEVHAGGRRLRALDLLVKQGRMNRNQPIPCIVQDAGLSEEISLAENDSRLPLHPLDQYRAFRAMTEKGMTRADIAVRFFTTERVVEQRLRLAKVSPALCDLYAADEITLDQMTAFTVGATHADQEAVWRKLGKTYDKGAHAIRRELTRETARANGGSRPSPASTPTRPQAARLSKICSRAATRTTSISPIPPCSNASPPESWRRPLRKSARRAGNGSTPP